MGEGLELDGQFWTAWAKHKRGACQGGRFWLCRAALLCRDCRRQLLTCTTWLLLRAPTAEGILFSVRPPKKSWKNIANLSGGEKTLSSLSLVFALHHYKPTPLYVMDEIDAALGERRRGRRCCCCCCCCWRCG